MANKKRLIDLDKAFEAINQEIWWTESEKAYFRSFLAKQPKVDAVEVVYGRWEQAEYHGFLRCSECKDVYIDDTWVADGKWNYCPNCGADMR